MSIEIREIPFEPVSETELLNHQLSPGPLLISPDNVYNKLKIVNPISFCILIDIRDETSYERSHIAGSVNFDVNSGNILEKFEDMFSQIKNDVERPMILHGF